MGASEIGVLPIRTVLVPTTVFAAGAASEVPLMVQGYSGQTGNLQEWRDSSGNLLSYVGPNGGVHAGQTVSVGAPRPTTDIGAYFQAGSATTRPLVIRAAASQSANLIEWQNNNGSALGYVDPAGKIILGTSQNVILRPDNTSGFYAATATTIPVSITAAASQTANLQEWRDSGNNILAAVLSTGRIQANSFVPNDVTLPTTSSTTGLYDKSGGTARLYTGDGTGWAGLRIAHRNGSTTTDKVFFNDDSQNTTVTVRAGASQGGNLTQWQNNAGAVIAAVTGAGDAFFGGIAAQVIGTSGVGANISAQARVTGQTPLVLKSFGSPQTANLTEWQRSDGVNYAYISPTGRANFSDGVTVRVSTGAVTDATFSAAPPDGTIAVDSTNNRIWVRLNGVWRYASLT